MGFYIMLHLMYIYIFVAYIIFVVLLSHERRHDKTS